MEILLGSSRKSCHPLRLYIRHIAGQSDVDVLFFFSPPIDVLLSFALVLVKMRERQR